MNKTMLTVMEAAKAWGYSPATIQRRIVSGELPAIKNGHSYLVPENGKVRLKVRRHPKQGFPRVKRVEPVAASKAIKPNPPAREDLQALLAQALDVLCRIERYLS